MSDAENSQRKNFFDRLLDKLLDSEETDHVEGARLEMNPPVRFHCSSCCADLTTVEEQHCGRCAACSSFVAL